MHGAGGKHNKAFTLLDTLIGVTLFLLVALALYEAFFGLGRVVSRVASRSAATALLMEEIEIIRTMPYEDVGLVGGLPAGILPQDSTVTRNGKAYQIHRIIRSVDDPFDGTITSAPQDTSPADYKLVQVQVSCTGCTPSLQADTTTTIAPVALETSASNGALFVRVIDANGQPVANANVSMVNPSLNPAVSFNDITDATGWLRLVDVPPALNSYQITVAKDGYSTDQTYTAGAPQNPNPLNPHMSVVAGAVTQKTFAIDQTSSLTIQSRDNQCDAVPNISYTIVGSKLIGTQPDVLKFSESQSTDGSGNFENSALEWDTYTITLTSGLWWLAGSLPNSPFALAPGTNDIVSLIVSPKTPNALLVEALDAATQLPVPHAAVAVAGPGYNRTIDTGEGNFQQTDWSGGAGQDLIGDPAQYFTSGSVDTASPMGELKLVNTGGTYAQNGFLISSTFDFGTSTNYFHLTIHPGDAPPQAGVDPVRIQIASNNDNATWNFTGPDGTAGTYYTPANRTLHSSHLNKRYVRYHVDLSTADTSVTPNVSDITLSFAASCIPSGAAFFSDVGLGAYTIDVTKDGYQPTSVPINLNSGWQKSTISLSPL